MRRIPFFHPRHPYVHVYHYACVTHRPAAGLLRLIPSFEGRPEGSVTITFELSFPRRILRYNAAWAAVAAGNSVTNYIYYDCRLSLSLSPPLLSLVPPHYLAHVTMKTTSVRWLVKPGTRRTRAGSRQGKMIITKIYEVRGCSITIHTPQMSSILRTRMHNACAFFTNCIILGTGEGYSKIIFSFIIFFFTTRPSPLQGRWTYWLK